MIPDTLGLGVLVHDRRSDSPIVVEIYLESCAAAPDLLRVEVVLDERRVVRVEAVAHAPDDVACGVADGIAAIITRTAHVVDVARIPLVESDTPEGDIAGDWQVDHAFQLAPDPAMIDAIDLGIHASGGDA